MNPSLFETRHGSDTALPLHRHGQPYAALVLAGEYLEFGPDGPVRCGPGSLVMHPPFHAHGNHFGRRGARVLNLALPLVSAAPAFSARQVPDLAVAREALGCGPAAPAALAALLRDSEALAVPPAPDWQAALVQALAEGDEPVGRIARRLGVSLAHASRSIRSAYGLAPQALRRELRWRRALALLAGDAPLAQIAASSGFADQSHFTRTTRLCAGLTPAALRRQINCVQDGG